MFKTMLAITPIAIQSFTLTPVRSIITSQAFSSSLLNGINEEFISDTGIVKDLFQYHLHIPLDILCASVFVITFWYQISTMNERKNWEDIGLYNEYRRRFNMVLMFLFIVFVRNIDNAI